MTNESIKRECSHSHVKGGDCPYNDQETCNEVHWLIYSVDRWYKKKDFDLIEFFGEFVSRNRNQAFSRGKTEGLEAAIACIKKNCTLACHNQDAQDGYNKGVSSAIEFIEILIKGTKKN